MIILSAGMPRAGSGWYYNLTNDLVVAAGHEDGRKIRKRYHLERVLTEINCNIGTLTVKRLLPVLVPSLLGNTFVIKTHARPTPFAQRLIQRGWLLPTYIYRDPRDAMLSAYEYGMRGLQKGRPNAFSHLTDFEESLDFIMEYVRIWEQWMACSQALHTRYEDLKTDYDREANRLVAFLGLNADDPGISDVLDKHRPEKANAYQKGTHFSVGVSGRFREAYTVEELAILENSLGGYLRKMKYTQSLFSSDENHDYPKQ